MIRRVGWLLVVPGLAQAMPLQFTQQGRLLDSAGVPINGAHQLDVGLYTGPSGGTPIWDDDVPVTLQDGYYSVLLGADATDPILASWFMQYDALYIGVGIDSGDELGSRTRLVPVPFALVAQNVDGGIVDASEIRVDGDVVIDSNGTIPASALQAGTISGDVSFSGTVTIDGPLVSKGSIILSPSPTTWTAFAAGYPETWRNICGNADYHPCGTAEAWVRLYTGGATAVGPGGYWTTGSISREGDSGSTKGLLASWWGSSPAGTDCAAGTHLSQSVYASEESQFHAPGCRADSTSMHMLCCYDY